MSIQRYTITQGHMNVGVPGKSCYCAVAVSICEQMGIKVDLSQLRVRIMPHTMTIDGLKYRVPGNVRDWLEFYDTGGEGSLVRKIMKHWPATHRAPSTVPAAIGPFSFWLTPKDTLGTL